jgi:hypothetical protein
LISPNRCFTALVYSSSSGLTVGDAATGVVARCGSWALRVRGQSRRA